MKKKTLTAIFAAAITAIVTVIALTACASSPKNKGAEIKRVDPVLANLDANVEKAFTDINAALPANLKPNATIAVFPITAASADYAELYLENLTIKFVNAGYTVVEKRRVEELLAEYDFQFSGLVGEPTLGELLGADAVIFSSIANDGTFSSWAVDTSKRTTLAKSVLEKEVSTVEYPPLPQQLRNSNFRELYYPWIDELIEIGRANPTAPFPPPPVLLIGHHISGIDNLISAYRTWRSAFAEVRGEKRELIILPITGGTNNEAETIRSFLVNNNRIQNNYSVFDMSGETAFLQYAGIITSLPIEKQWELRQWSREEGAVFSGTIQQIGRKNTLILNAYIDSIIYSQSLEYSDSLELWVKLQSAVENLLVMGTVHLRNRRSGIYERTALIYSQFGPGVNRSEAEMLTQLLINDTLSIPFKTYEIIEMTDQTGNEERVRRSLEYRFRFNWSRSGNNTRLDITVPQLRADPRYSLVYGSQQEFLSKMRGLSEFVYETVSLGYKILGLDNYNLAAAEPARIPANFTKITRVITQGGVPSGSFHISNAPVTQREYERIMRQNPSIAKNPAQPVNNVSIIDAMIFCNQLSIRDGLEPAYLIEAEIERQANSENIHVSSVFVDNFATGYRLATTDEWRFAHEKTEGMGFFAEYVFDGEFVQAIDGLDRGYGRLQPGTRPYRAGRTMYASAKGTAIGPAVRINEGSQERRTRYEIPAYEEEVANNIRYSVYPVIRLVRPIFDYWKYTSGM
jgi:hypothetical protein